jgi:hypothetical protein
VASACGWLAALADDKILARLFEPNQAPAGQARAAACDALRSGRGGSDEVPRRGVGALTEA